MTTPKKIKRILLIDDDRASRYLTVKLLEELAITQAIDEVKNGKEACQYLRFNCWGSARRFDCPELILLDLNMPVMDGFEFLNIIRILEEMDSSQIKIFVLTTSSLTEDRENALRYPNIAGYITKPLTTEKVDAILANFV
jgi:CheY-like chemotaxis protein